MRKWLINMLSADGNVSSKRVVGFGAFLAFIAEIVVHLVTGRPIQVEVLWTTVALITACFGLNALVDIKALSGKSEVATQMAASNTKDPAASKAQELVSTPDDKLVKEAKSQGIEPFYPDVEEPKEYTPD